MTKVVIDVLYFNSGLTPFWEVIYSSKVLYREIPPSLFDTNLLARNIIWGIIVVISSIFVIIDDIIYGMMIPTRLGQHGDFFNISIVVGKVLIHVLAAYFYGFLFY